MGLDTSLPHFSESGHGELVALARSIALAEASRIPISQLVALRRRLPERARTTIARSAGAAVVVVTSETRPPRAAWAVLTPRERAVAGEISNGLSNKRIAARLGITEGTVKDHVHHILRKTGLSSRVAIAVEAQSTDAQTITERVHRRHPSKDREGLATRPRVPRR
jgi:DNA-binding NarL/FixJ family response regulator